MLEISDKHMRDMNVYFFISCYSRVINIRQLFGRARIEGNNTSCLSVADIHRISIDLLRPINESCYF